MSAFESITFDLKSADAELISFKSWLAAATFVGEAVISDEVGTVSSQKMRQNKDLESFAIATRSRSALGAED